MGVSDGKPGQGSGFGASVGVSVILHARVSRRRAEFDQLPRHGPQIIRRDETALHLVRSRRSDFLAGPM